MLGQLVTSMMLGIAKDKLIGGTKAQPVPKPPSVNLRPFMARSGKRTGYSPKSKAAPVVGSALTATSKYNSVLRKMLNITKYS
jgi:hypothetical protein|tara:strand:- start:1621 stop:1869 length:249 start_codon:yes stop_codon:yes gene_type:complete